MNGRPSAQPGGSRALGWAALALFLACIPGANYLISHVGTVCTAEGVCLVPVAPGLMAPSGVLTVGIALVLRDVVQRQLGAGWALGAVFVGTGLSALIAPAALVVASAGAFLLSELTDFAIYTPLQRRHLVLAVVLSSLGGIVIDSLVFLQLAFHSQQFLLGQVVGKAWAVLVSVPVIQWLRRVTPAPA